MSLYDIIDDISERQAVKTETGDNRIYGVMVGIVAKNSDPKSSKGGGSNSGANAMDGRVCVTIPTRNDKANELRWARVAMPSSGTSWGHHFLPEIGDQVLLAFEGGNIEKPYVIGCIPKTGDFPTNLLDKDNQTKAIVTRNGNSLIFTDNAQDDKGAKDKIQLETGGQTISLLMDNENAKFRISEKNNKNFIEMTTGEKDGKMTLQAASSMVLRVGDKIEITMNGSSGKITINADTVEVHANTGIKLKSTQSVNVEGATIAASANTSLKLECKTGVAKVSGASVNIG